MTPHFKDWRKDTVRRLKPEGPPPTRQQQRLIRTYASEIGQNPTMPDTADEAAILLARLIRIWTRRQI